MSDDDDYWTRGYVDQNRSDSIGSSISDEELRDRQERRDAEFGFIDSN